MDWFTLLTKVMELSELAFITLLIGFTFAMLVRKFLSWLGGQLNFGSLVLPLVVEQVLVLTTVIVVLFQFGLHWLVFALGVVILLLVFVWIVFSSWDALRNRKFARKVSLMLDVGDPVVIGDISGTVRRIGFTSVRVQNEEVFELPHAFVIKNLNK